MADRFHGDDGLAELLLDVPPGSSVDDVLADVRGARDERIGERHRRGVTRRGAFALGTTAVASLVIGGGVGATYSSARGDDRPATTPNAPTAGGVLGFVSADGWTTGVVDMRMPRFPDLQAAWTTNAVVVDENVTASTPVETLKTLPADAVFLYVSIKHGAEAGAQPSQLPLELADGRFFSARDGYEMQPAPHVSVILISADVDDTQVGVDVYFGTNDPSPTLRALAQEALSRLRLP